MNQQGDNDNAASPQTNVVYGEVDNAIEVDDSGDSGGNIGLTYSFATVMNLVKDNVIYFQHF